MRILLKNPLKISQFKFHKFHIALKECAETEYWIELLAGSHCIDNEVAEQLLQECGIVRRMLSKSITTAKGNTK